MLKVGLTGNIASGKSEVEKIISNLGYKVFDLDIISHEVLENECRKEILKEFQTLDRKKIGQIVFNDKRKKEILEKIIHPILKNKVLSIFENNRNENMIFISGALIFEAGFDSLFDKIIFIEANKDLRLNRLTKRNNLNIQQALIRINSQNEKSKLKADYIVENNTTTEKLEINVKKTIEALKLL